jgi:DNA-binding MarR family transcriptional regulator
VPTIARTLGVSRQAVQRVVGELQRDGLVEPRPNPHHKTAKLIAPTARGQDAVDAATRRFTHWANRATADLDADRMKAARRLLETLRERVRAYDPEAP